MLRCSSIKLDDIGNWQIGCEEPNRAERSHCSSAPWLDASENKDGKADQSQNREVLRKHCFSPAAIALITCRIENASFHMEVSGKDHKPSIVTKRSQHQDRPDWCRPSGLAWLRRPLLG